MTVASVDQRKRFSLEILIESRTAKAIIGLVSAVIMVGAILFIVGAFTGRFTNVMKIRGALPGNGSALPVGSLVLYNNITVGKIGTEGVGAGGQIAVTMDLYPAKAAKVPRNVQAYVFPLSIFGNQGVELALPNGAAAATTMIQLGDFIPADSATPSTSLQQTSSQLYTLLNAIKPADLDTALTAFATALQGEGKTLGTTLREASNYLALLNPLLPTTQADLGLLTPVSNSINQAAPNVIGTLGNSVTTGGAISSNASALASLLHNGASSASQLDELFTGVQTTLPNLLNSSGPVLADISSNPQLLQQTLSGLGQFSSAVAAAETHGPFLTVNVNLPIVNTSAAVDAALGYNAKSELATALGSVVNPAPYTAADCPRYAGEQSYCATGDSPAAPSGTAAATTSAVVPAGSTSSGSAGTQAAAAQTAADPFAAEVAAVQSIASAMGGGRTPAVPGLASMVLFPLYSSMATSS